MPALLGTTAGAARAGDAEPGGFSSRVLATGLANPWEITWGPDRHLWVTEQDAGRVSRIRPSDGARATLLDIPELLHTGPESLDGLLGMALKPEWSQGRRPRRVCVAYAYDAAPSPATVAARARGRPQPRLLLRPCYAPSG